MPLKLRRYSSLPPTIQYSPRDEVKREMMVSNGNSFEHTIFAPTMSTNLVVRDDHVAEGATASSSSSGIVLDALPYVEPLEPSYEQYALSLVVSSSSSAVAGAEHPSLSRILPSRSIGNRSLPPLAAAAYESVVARKRGDDGVTSNDESAPLLALPERPDPMANIDLASAMSTTMDKQQLISDLRTSIATSKIRLEVERHRHINLELYSHLETQTRFADYATLLETQYRDPTSNSVERQRRVVDSINGLRMEEQQVAARKLDGLKRRREQLIEGNRRLGRALGALEGDVDVLRKEVAAIIPNDD